MRNVPQRPDDMTTRYEQLYREKYKDLKRCTQTLFRCYQQMTPNDGQIEEVVQETFSIAWQRREEVFSRDNPGGWLYEALRVNVKKFVREEVKWKRALQAYEEHEEHHSEVGPERDLSLLDIQRVLTKEEARLAHQIYWEGRTYIEICRELHISKSALASRLHRIKKKLRIYLK